MGRGETYATQAGPHCAVGRIVYPDGARGVLVYFKSSVTGDEKDYILDYKRCNPSFPHETTTDQFFTEEQFEAYRALGFHIVDHFFGEADDFAVGRKDGIREPRGRSRRNRRGLAELRPRGRAGARLAAKRRGPSG